MLVRPEASLAARVFRAGSWTLMGNVLGQALRFGSNLVMTRLLFPEAFGLMAVVQSILLAANLLSDIGLKQSVVRSERGDDPSFLNTVWTLQAIKGVLIAVALAALSPLLASAYGQPALQAMLAAMGLTAVITGFESPRVALAARQLQLARVVQMELLAQCAGIVVMMGWAWMQPSVWALVAGNLASATITVALSHLWIRGPGLRWQWDRATVSEVARFGGWVLLSSGITYLAGEGRQLLVAALTDIRTVGLLVLSTTLALVVWNAIQQVAQRALFPAYSEVWRQRPQDLAHVVRRSRLIQLAAGCTVSLLLVMWGDALVGALYDSRYAAAGAYLQIQAAGTLFGFLSGSYAGVLWALGRPGLSSGLLGLQVLVFFALMGFGHALGGTLGMVAAGSATGILIHLPNFIVFRRLGLADFRLDFPVLLLGTFAGVQVYLHGAWRQL